MAIIKTLVNNEVYTPQSRVQRGVIHFEYTSGTVTLQGSCDGTNFVDIETISADAIKEIVLPPFFRWTGGGSATVMLSETN